MVTEEMSTFVVRRGQSALITNGTEFKYHSCNSTFERVEEFKYLGTTLAN